MGWVDDANFIENADRTLYVRRADTGAVVRAVPVEDGVAYGPFHQMPPGSNEPYIVQYRGGIYTATRNFRAGRTIWAPSAPQRDSLAEFYPRVMCPGVDVDVAGEWVAWAMTMTSKVAQPSSCTSLDTANAALMVPKWYMHAPDSMSASTTISNGIIYEGAWDGTMYAIDVWCEDEQGTKLVDGDAKVDVARD